jgi:hypothetical protein
MTSPLAKNLGAGPPAALPGANVWRRSWCDGTHCHCAARHAINDNYFLRDLKFRAFYRNSKAERGRTSTTTQQKHTYLFSPAAIYTVSSLEIRGFCTKLRAPHRGTSLNSCVCGANNSALHTGAVRPHTGFLKSLFFISPRMDDASSQVFEILPDFFCIFRGHALFVRNAMRPFF